MMSVSNLMICLTVFMLEVGVAQSRLIILWALYIYIYICPDK